MLASWVIPAAGWLLFAIWFVNLAPLWPAMANRWLRRRAADLPPLTEWPLVTVIVPARDEGAKIEAGLRSLLALDYPQLEIIAVDDRSTDATGAVMDQLAAGDDRLRVIHVRELPAGWLGKNHAMHVAAQAARGELLLFTDGDVLFAPETLRLAVLYVQHRRVDHLAMLCDLIPGGFWENAATAFFAMVFFANAKPWLIATPYKHAYVGVGAFNLVRRSAYLAIGGHERIRLDVLDDVNLGRLIKCAGRRQDLLISGPLVRVRWQNSLWGMIRGLEKNGFAAVQFSLTRLVAVTLLLLALTLTPYVAAALLRDARVVPFAASLLLMHATQGEVGRRFGYGWGVTLLLPWGMFMFLFACWRSAAITLRQGGVRWRDTFYPLDLLRANQFGMPQPPVSPELPTTAGLPSG